MKILPKTLRCFIFTQVHKCYTFYINKRLCSVVFCEIPLFLKGTDKGVIKNKGDLFLC